MRAILIALSAASLLLAAACSTTSTPTEEQKPAATPPATTPQTPAETKPVEPPTQTGSGINPLKDPNNILSKRSIYFEFDKFDVKDEFRPVVEAHAKYLRDNPSAKMLIQGNADERGSREYNVGLGQRRSDSVKSMLKLLGVRDAQIEAVSLGEEKPSCSDHTEACWAKNRRADMLYTGEY
jgi:peptidoglycan-associated lipoprotein